MSEGSASIVIDRPADVVWAVLSDVTRMGEWSPECVACRWTGGATAPAAGATFEGDNEARVAGRVVKRWTTTSEVTDCEPGRVFAFTAAGYTTWRYELRPEGVGTVLTESFRYRPAGVQGFLYDAVLRRPATMTTGMRRTLARLKASIESS
jgi:hypothetical protein